MNNNQPPSTLSRKPPASRGLSSAKRKILPALCLAISLALSARAFAGVTIDFQPSGELASQFSAAGYSESASGGLGGSIGVALPGGTTPVAGFDGTASEKFAANAFANGASFTVGAFIKMSSLSTQVFRLGLNNGGSDTFGNMPYADITNAAGVFKFDVRGTVDSGTFSLSTGQWYYFEATFTRAGDTNSTVIDYTVTLCNAGSSGNIGSVIRTASLSQNTGIGATTEVNGIVYGGFRQSQSAGVMDNFFVSTNGQSQLPAMLVATRPADNAAGVPLGDNLVATFNKNIQAGTGNITLKRSSDNSTVETFNVASSPRLTFSNATLTINPTSDLLPDTGYYVLIDTNAVQDASANYFAGITNSAAWNFTATRQRFLPAGDYNVLFIAVDDLKANFGPFVTPELAEQMPTPITPHLDSLAASGMSFTRAYCQQAVCWASRASLLTGSRPDTTKLWDDGPLFRDTMPGVITLPQHFVSQGFSSAGYGKIYDFRTTADGGGQDAALSWPDGQGDKNVSWDNTGTAHKFYEDGHWQVEQAATNGSTARQTLFSTDAGITNYWASPPRPVNPDTDYQDGINASDAIVKLNSFATNYLNTGKRFFLAVGFHLPHLPFSSPKSFWGLYDPAQIVLTNEVTKTAYTGARTVPAGTLPFTAADQEIGSYNDIPKINGKGVPSPSQARELIHGYLAATSFMDYQLGRVMAALNASGVASNTIIVLWGDHGWHLGDHNGFWCKHSNYEQATRSPLIIRAPGMAALGTAGKACLSPVEFVDIYPTLLELAGLPTPVQPAGLELQGSSLRPLLEDPAQPWKKAAFSQYARNISGSGVANPGQGMGYSVRTSRYRYTEWWRTQTSTISGPYGLYSLTRDVKLFSTPEHIELYDMLNDPNETVNQATNAAFAGVKAELAAALAGGYGWTNASVAVPPTYPTNFAAWRTSLVEPGYPLATFVETNDPDGDGVKNLMEYGMGIHPLCADTGLPSSSVTNISGTRFAALGYPTVNSRTDVATRGVMSTNLTAWSTNGVIADTLGTNVNRTLWRSRIPLDGAVPPAGFLRLESIK